MPHSARIKLGDDALDLRVSANPDRAGEYLGPMVSWSIVTKWVELADNFETNVLGVIDTVATEARRQRGGNSAAPNSRRGVGGGLHERPDGSRVLDLVIHRHNCYPGAP